MAQHSIPCSPECKIVGLILLDHCLSYVLTATADVPAVYLQQFWRTVSKVPDIEDTIKFLLDTEQFIYTVDVFRDTLNLLVETPENPFVAPTNIHTIEAFMNRVGYQGVVDKVSDFFTKNLAQPWQTMFKVFNRCLTRRTSGHDQTKDRIEPGSHKEKAKLQRVKKDDDDSKDRIEPGSHKENPKFVVDDDDKANSLEIRNEETQTTIPTPPSSLRKILSLDKKINQELMDIVSILTITTSKHLQVKKRISSKYYLLPGTLRRIDDIPHEIVPQIAENVINDLIEYNLKPCIANTIIEDRDAFRSEVHALVSQEFNAHASAIIEELFKSYIQSNVVHVQPTTTTSTKTDSTTAL
ncbi:hypothetical protein Tco_1560170 [Tanacetum coccineum]